MHHLATDAAVDQNPRKLGLRCVQAYVDLLGTTNENQPGNRLYEGSHDYFEELTQAVRGDVDNDWVKIDSHGLGPALEAKCALVKPTCPPGSMVLWESRTTHSPDDGSDFEQGRFVVYVCYLPYDQKVFTAKQEEKKRDAFTNMRATTHCPFPQELFGKHARTYGREMLYMEAAPEHLYASGMAPHLTSSTVTQREALKQLTQPDATEKLLFGFQSYSKLPTGIGLQRLRWTSPPLLTLTLQSTPLVPLTVDALRKRQAKRDAENQKRKRAKEAAASEPRKKQKV